MSFFKNNAHWLLLSTTAALSVAGSFFLFQDITEFPDALEKLYPKQVASKKPDPIRLDSLERATKLVALSGQWKAEHDNLLFVSEPYLLESDGPKRPKEGSLHRHSKTGAAIPNAWFLQFGLKLRQPNITQEDSDGDGFTNEEEWLAGTDPIDASKHPLLVSKLTFVRAAEIHNHISFLQYLGEKLTVRRDDAPKRPQHDVKVGDVIPDTEIKLASFEKRRKDDSGIKDALDGSLVTLIDGKTANKQIAEIKGKPADFVDKTFFLELKYPKEQREITAKPGGQITLNAQETYTIIDSTPNGVQIKDKDGKLIEVGRTKTE